MAEAGRPPTTGLLHKYGVTVAVAVMNVTSYAFTLVASRLLGPAEFGAVAALMGLLLVLNVAGLGLQTTAARRVSTAGGQTLGIARQVMAVTYVASAGLGLLTLLMAPVVTWGFDLGSPATAPLLAVAVGLQTLFFGQAGVIQGERRWVPLAWLYALNGTGRLACGLVAMAVRPDALGAMLGVTAGALAPVLVGTLALRRDGALRPAAWSQARPLVGELARNARALLAFLGVSNADIIVARIALTPYQAGLYAGGLILAKAVLFLPQFLIVLGFPTMAAGGDERARNHPRALGVLALLGFGTVAGAAVLPALALEFVGGAQYDGIRDRLWLFAFLGLALSLVQFLVYDAVARQDHAALSSVWLAFGLLLTSALVVGAAPELLLWAVVVDTVLFGVLVARSFAPQKAARPTP